MKTNEYSMTTDFATVMHSLSKVGDFHSGEKRTTTIDVFLKELTIYTKADSCCIYEYVNNNSYERAYMYIREDSLFPGTEDAPLLFSSYDLPYWHELFKRGNSVILENVEKIREDCPCEYGLLKKQQLQSVIAFPIIFNKLIGFVKINDPKCRQLQALHASLPVIGSYLGSIRTNYLKNDILEKHELLLNENRLALEQHAQLLNENQQALAENRQSLAKNQQELTESRQSLAKSQQELAENRQSLAKNQQELTESRQSLAKSQQELAENRQSLAQSQQELAENRQSLAQSQQELVENKRSLAENQQSLEENQLALHQERTFLNVLCRDYTAVYFADLSADTVEPLKLDRIANAARFVSLKDRHKERYSEIMTQYCHRFVVEDQTTQFMEYMSIPYLTRELQNKERIVFRYQSIPNVMGQQYFETQIIRISDTDFDNKILVGFRHIDDLVASEQKQQRDLEVALQSAQRSNEVLSALGQIYYSIFLIDLVSDHYEEISSDTKVHHLTGKSGQASTEMLELCQTFVVEEYREGISQFFDLSTLAKRLQKDETIATEYLATDGNWHTARFIVKNRNADGQATHVLYVTRLISDAKRREQNWIAIVEEANKANIAKTEFISQIAHDIRTPMNAIMGFTEITEAHINDPEHVRYGLDKIKVSGSFLLELVDDVLDISRIENGQMKLNPQKISIQELYDELVPAFDQAHRGKRLNCNYHLHDISHDGVLADPMRLKQIFANILSNAVKYTPEGGQVEFDLYEEEAETKDKVRLVAVIRDNGIGMSEEYMTKMFSKFSRETDTRINKVSGHGLGLSIVKMLCDLMNGTIDVKSKPGEGTTFRLTFEFICVDLDSDTTKTELLPDYAALCKGMHLLVAEDNNLNYEVVYELLRMNGITCEWANNGAVCVQKFQDDAKKYDAILMDLQMPVMDGLHATTTIRSMRLPEAHSIPIIAMTANAFQEDIQKCLNAGMNLHLSKPIHIEKLLEALASFR